MVQTRQTILMEALLDILTSWALIRAKNILSNRSTLRPWVCFKKATQVSFQFQGNFFKIVLQSTLLDTFSAQVKLLAILYPMGSKFLTSDRLEKPWFQPKLVQPYLRLGLFIDFILAFCQLNILIKCFHTHQPLPLSLSLDNYPS